MKENNKNFARCLCNELESFVIEYRARTINEVGYNIVEPAYNYKEKYQIRYFLLEELLKPLIVICEGD